MFKYWWEEPSVKKETEYTKEEIVKSVGYPREREGKRESLSLSAFYKQYCPYFNIKEEEKSGIGNGQLRVIM